MNKSFSFGGKHFIMWFPDKIEMINTLELLHTRTEILKLGSEADGLHHKSVSSSSKDEAVITMCNQEFKVHGPTELFLSYKTIEQFMALEHVCNGCTIEITEILSKKNRCIHCGKKCTLCSPKGISCTYCDICLRGSKHDFTMNNVGG